MLRIGCVIFSTTWSFHIIVLKCYIRISYEKIADPKNNSTYAGTDPCKHSGGVKIHLLENRVTMLENQNVFMNNMLIQNQTQATIRDSQLLMNSQHY